MVRLTTRHGLSGVRGGGAVGVDVYESVIDSYWQPGGLAVEYANEQAYDVANEARTLAPQRSGTLRAWIRARPSRSTGKRSVRSSVWSSAPHSLWVHEGTSTQYLSMGPRLIPAGGPQSVGISRSRHPVPSHFSTRLVKDKIEGQRANPFLRDALSTARQEWGIRGVPRRAPWVRPRGLA